MKLEVHYKISLRGKLLASFLSLSLLLVLLTWALLFFFLDDIYRGVRITAVRNACEKLSLSDDSNYEYFLHEASDNGICINVYDSRLNLIAGEHAGGQCVVHNISKSTVKLFYESVLDIPGGSFETFLPADKVAELLKKTPFYNDHFFPFFGSFYDHGESSDVYDPYDCVFFAKITTNSEGDLRFILLSATIIPIESTNSALLFCLILVTFVSLLVSLVIAALLSRSLARPISCLNRASKELSKGSFEASDIKGYREIEELKSTLISASDEINKSDRLRKELIANVSHDLRTPLTLISSYSEAMRDLPGENTPENLQIIIDEAKRLSELVTDLMDLSKLEAGIQKPCPVEIELIGFVRSLLERYRKFTEVQGYRIFFRCEENEIRVMADSVQLNQVLYNLINNAIHYCGSDKTVIVSLTKEKRFVLVEVTDHGAGISPENLDSIWDRYYKVDRNHSPSAIGTGLGLSIVKKVLESHGAEFGVQSSVGVGSNFWFRLSLSEHTNLDEG